ncbi:unnamed protein product [Adineta ricciae]|uniref:Uncharacterized protein n=1 Tax=Adineta ricciae TaxID=249248 RepID=A0A813Q8T1_ADIRI|nr:unnamed protein product [Adineta ricciae]CAF1399299.1 unnamed protein product [Adineta ricciae]
MSRYFIIAALLATNLSLSIGPYVRICNHGVFLAKCYLEMQTLTYGLSIRRSDTGLFPVVQCATLDMPYDVVWSQMECKALTFIATYRSIFITEIPSGLLNTCFTLTGTILNPSWSQTRC